MKPIHYVVLLVVVLLLFGAPKLPELARNLGKSLRILKEETQSLTSDDPPASAKNAEESSPKEARDD